MSFTDTNGEPEQLFDQKSSDSDDNFQTDEEIDSEENFSESLNNFQNTTIDSNHSALKVKKCFARNQRNRKSTPFKCSRFNRQFEARGKLRKSVKEKNCKKSSKKNKKGSIKQADVSHKGKRCRREGKTNEKPLEEGDSEKLVSDDDSDNFYIGRISLGYFQNFKDKSGASTSNQWEEDNKDFFAFKKAEEPRYSQSEELELLELQKWGRTATVSCCIGKTDDLESTDLFTPEKL